jgi:hypothetical protein
VLIEVLFIPALGSGTQVARIFFVLAFFGIGNGRGDLALQNAC